MSKNTELSSKARKAANDLNSLEGRYNSYVSSIERGVETGTFTNDEVTARRHDGCLSVIDGLGAAELRNHLTTEQKESLVTSLRDTTAAVLNTLQSEPEKEKLAVNTAKVEAILKGFELPLSLGGPSDELDPHGLNMEEHYPKIIKATKEALVELGGQGISPEEYSDKIQSLILEKVKDDFSPGQLESVEKIIAQGQKLKDSEKPLEKQKFQSSDLKSLQDTATKTFNQFQNILRENEQDVTMRDIIQDTTKEVVENHDLKVSSARQTKLYKNISPALAQLDPEYLKQHKDIIANDLAKDLQNQSSMWGRMNGELRTSTQSQMMIADKILEKHLDASEKFVENKISGEFYKQQLTNSQMADRLNEFSKAAGTEQVFKPSGIPSDKDLAQMRKTNPKLFDKLVLEKKPAPEIPSNIKKKLEGNMKVSSSKSIAPVNARGKSDKNADRGI